MKDFAGRELHIGDEVVIMAGSGGAATNLHKGRIISFVQRGKFDCANVSYSVRLLREPLTPMSYPHHASHFEEHIATVSSSKIMLNEKIV